MNNLTPSQADRTALTGNTLPQTNFALDIVQQDDGTLQCVFGDYPVRVTKDNRGKFWFVVNDLAAAAGIADLRQRMPTLKDNQKATVYLLHGIQRRLTNVVSESGMYKLLMRANPTPLVDAFVDWISEEVLPAIRERGFYVSDNATVDQLTALQAETQERLNVALQENGRLGTQNENYRHALDGAEAARRKGWYGGHAGLSHPDGEDER